MHGMARSSSHAKIGGVERATRQLDSSSVDADIALHRVGQPPPFGGSAKGQTDRYFSSDADVTGKNER